MNRRDFLSGALAVSAIGILPSISQAATADNINDVLSEHKLHSLEIRRVALRYPRLVGKNSHLGVHGRGPDVTVCIIRTDKGASGWGHLLCGRDRANELFAQLKGRPLTELFLCETGTINKDAMPFDFALHDLAGVIANLPVYKMLGAKGPKSNLCYSGMVYFDDLEPAEMPQGISAVLRNAHYDYDYGYRQLKLKIGRGYKWMDKNAGLMRDIAVTRAIASELPGVEILVDGNDGFTLAEFKSYIDGIGNVPLFWIEEPFRETVADYRVLREHLVNTGKARTLLADGEANPQPEFIAELIRDRVIDVNLFDICWYSFTGWRKLLAELKTAGALASPHAWGDALKTNYTAHLASGLGGVVTIEGVTCTSEDVDLSTFKLESGRIVTPDKPGFGMELKQS
jgi:L-alanine-DL-glutamate epimerase-like enolase superfamily enzyme